MSLKLSHKNKQKCPQCGEIEEQCPSCGRWSCYRCCPDMCPSCCYYRGFDHHLAKELLNPKADDGPPDDEDLYVRDERD